MTRIAALVSGGGTNLQALLDNRDTLGGEIVCVVSSRADAYALDRAKSAGVPAITLHKDKSVSREAYSERMITLLKGFQVDLVVLCGFLVVMSDTFVQAYPNRILNIHPALLPAFGGIGCYGIHVHKMALDRGVKITGATVHFVNEEVDGGPIVLQKSVDVLPNDDPQTLQQRVMEQAEWVLLPQAVRLFCEGRLCIENNIVRIREESI